LSSETDRLVVSHESEAAVLGSTAAYLKILRIARRDDY
jgi:hypothetical protein